MRKRKRQRGLWHVWGFEVNLNTVLTTVLGSLACSGVAACLYGMHTIMTNIRVMERDVPVMEQTLKRLTRDYPVLAKPSFSASVNAPPPQGTPPP